jgi:hypothetical protein
MPTKNPVTLCLALIVSVTATIIGIRNLVWFVQLISSEPTKIERYLNEK